MVDIFYWQHIDCCVAVCKVCCELSDCLILCERVEAKIREETLYSECGFASFPHAVLVALELMLPLYCFAFLLMIRRRCGVSCKTAASIPW